MTREGGEKSQNCMDGGSFAQPKEMPCDMVPVLNRFLLKQLKMGSKKALSWRKEQARDKESFYTCHMKRCVYTLF